MKKIIKSLGFMIMALGMSLAVNNKVEAATITGEDKGYTYTVEEGSSEATITRYTGGETDITIPGTVDEYQVVKIGVNAFKDNKTIIYVNIPGTVKIICGSAFLNASNLKEVTIENGCETILASAFILCSNLEKIIIPASVTNMEYINAGSETFGGVDLKKLKVYLDPESAAQTYFDTYEDDIQYFYLVEYSPGSIAFSNPTLIINVGDTYTFSDSDFNVLPTTSYITMPSAFTTSDNSIAYISNGVLTARKEGSIIINAIISDEHLENDITTTTALTVNVVESRKKVESVSLNVDDEVILYVGDTLQLSAKVSPSDAVYTGEWETLAARGIVSVSETGLVTALKEGAEQVFYTTLSNFGNVYESNGKSVLIQVYEKPETEAPTTPTAPTTPETPTIPTTPTNPETPTTPTTPTTPETPTVQVGKITLNASKIDLQKGKTIKSLELKTNQLAGDKITSVASSNKKVLKASLKGQTISLKGLKTNSKYVTVTVTMQSGAKATCKVRVVGTAVNTKKLSISDKKLSLLKGDSAKLIVTRNPISATDKITWKSSNTKVATVDKNGKVKAKSAGKATITATSASGKKVTCKVTVSNVLNADTISIQKGKAIKTLAVTAKQLKGDSIASVKSSNSKILNVSLEGQTVVLKGLKTSSKYVTVTVNMASGAKGTCKVKVVKSTVKTQKITIDDTKKTLTAGESYQLAVTRNPISATDKVTYKSSNKKVATVDKEGNVAAMKKGKATITVTTASGKKATCKITVK